jgi:sulfatase maturation enzyme AslB (radical SAM superfamily)
MGIFRYMKQDAMSNFLNFSDSIHNKYILCSKTSFGTYVLFNRTNGAIIELLESEYESLCNGINVENHEMYQKIEESEIFNFKKVSLGKNIKSVYFTIEMSTICNLECTYCYQSNARNRPALSENIEDSIYLYIEKICNIAKEKEEFIFGFIGGEPLLHKEKVFRIINRLTRITEKYGKRACFSIDTNGTIDISEYIESVKRLSLSVSLTTKRDHNELRKSDTFDSFAKIVKNLKNYKQSPYFKVNIRYNTNHNNISEFESFVSFVKKELPIVTDIHASYTDNYEYNKQFYNKLTIQEFIDWNSSIAIDILIKHGFSIDWRLPSSLTMCYAYQPYSCKVLSDGSITLCDGMEYQRILTIEELAKDPSLLEKRYPVKQYNPTNDDFCKNCYQLVQCQGRVFCRNNKDVCNFQRVYNERIFLAKYVEFCHKGKQHLFVGM